MLRSLAVALMIAVAMPVQATESSNEAVVAQEQQTPVMKRDCESKRGEGVS